MHVRLLHSSAMARAVDPQHPPFRSAILLAIGGLIAECMEETRPLHAPLNGSSNMRIAALVAILALSIGHSRWGRIRVVFLGAATILLAFAATHEGEFTVRFTEAAVMALVLIAFFLSPRSWWLGTGDSSPQLREGDTTGGAASSVVDNTLPQVLALLVYLGACTWRTGVRMCHTALDQVRTPDYGLVDSVASLGTSLCVACNGWAATSTACCGTTLSIAALCALFVIANPVASSAAASTPEATPDRVRYATLPEVLRSVLGICRLGVGLQSAALLSSFLALADCITHSPAVYDRQSCTIGGDGPAACPDQLIEFRRIGLVQHSLGSNTFGFLSLVLVMLRVERASRTMDGRRFTSTFVRSGVAFACLVSMLMVFYRTRIAHWGTDWIVEMSFVLVLVGCAATSFVSMVGWGATTIYGGLFVDYVYYCATQGECRSFRYLTNTSNAFMGVLFGVWFVLSTVRRYRAIILWIFTGSEDTYNPFHLAHSHPSSVGGRTASFLWQLEASVLVAGTSISTILALLVTSALSAYDGSDVSTLVDLQDVTNPGLSANLSVLRFILWHYAPLAAWMAASTAFANDMAWAAGDARHLVEAQQALGIGADTVAQWMNFIQKTENRLRHFTGVGYTIRIVAWFAAELVTLALWQAFRTWGAGNTSMPSSYPMSNFVLIVTSTIPAWAVLGFEHSSSG